jgi:hypothetical protein
MHYITSMNIGASLRLYLTKFQLQWRCFQLIMPIQISQHRIAQSENGFVRYILYYLLSNNQFILFLFGIDIVMYNETNLIISMLRGMVCGKYDLAVKKRRSNEGKFLDDIGKKEFFTLLVCPPFFSFLFNLCLLFLFLQNPVLCLSLKDSRLERKKKRNKERYGGRRNRFLVFLVFFLFHFILFYLLFILLL